MAPLDLNGLKSCRSNEFTDFRACSTIVYSSQNVLEMHLSKTRIKKKCMEIEHDPGFVDRFWFLVLFYLGEHPAAMQRGCANANIDMSIVLYIITLSMLLQQVNRITHGMGTSYDVIRWFKSITPKTMASPIHCLKQQQHQHQHHHHGCTNSSDYLTVNYPDQWSHRSLVENESPLVVVNNDTLLCMVRWNPITMEHW